MNILIIHHLEQEWAKPFFQITKFHLESMCENLANYLDNENYDRIILTTYNDDRHFDEVNWSLSEHVGVIHHYDYGWEKEHKESNPNELFCDGGSHSDYVWIPKWMQELKRHTVTICGIFDGACLDDLQTALDYLQIKYKRLNEFIV